MSKGDETHIKIEAGQILDPDHFPMPSELVCIQVPKVFDQASVRGCETLLNFPLKDAVTESANATFLRAFDFDITNITVVSQTDSMTKPGFKKLVLRVTVCFKVEYSFFNGYSNVRVVIPNECQPMPPCVTFDLTINEIYCPNCTTQIGLVRYPPEKMNAIKDEDGTFIKAEAILEAFNPSVTQAHSHTPVTPATALLTLDVGGFFIIKCECEVQLLIPAYGYCPVPPEQTSPTEQNCATFNNRLITPFPTQFFPNQKINPLDGRKKEDWDD